MNSTGYQLFAGSTLTGDQHIGIRVGYFLNQLVNVLDASALADDTFEVKARIITGRRVGVPFSFPGALKLFFESDFFFNFFLTSDILED